MRPGFVSWRQFDFITTAAVLILTFIGLATIYSVDLSRGGELSLFKTQAIALSIGVIIFFIASFLHISFYERAAKFIYLLSVVLLVAVLFFGVTVRGTTGWFHLGGFSFQPAEFAKIAIIIFLAWRMERQMRHFRSWQYVLISGIIAGLLAGLILMQPDLGSASIIMGIWFGLLVVAGTKKRYIFGLLSLGVFLLVISWFFLFQEYQKQRLITFLDPARDPLGAGYNVTQSIIAIGSGQITGRGLGFGSQSQLHFLPEAQTDFIFSVIGEELGFIGTLAVLALYFIILLRFMNIAKNARSDFSSYTVLGIAILLFLQMGINVGATLGMLPITGVTLPFVSYGGSSLIINFILLGIVQSVAFSRA